jgi:glycosyltransferase involved in cell wall biosynthesis
MSWIKKIVIISTKQNYKWVSMQEVLPSIAQCWKNSAIDLNLEYKLVNADTDQLRLYAQDLLSSDLIIIIAFNETIAKLMVHVRKNLGVDAPFILHLYGHATLGLWPEARFGALAVMNEGDTFIGTCPGDITCINLTSKNARVLDIPYPYFSLETISKNRDVAFVYVGRISDQKNLHLLIDSYYLLYLKKPTVPNLIIYGKEDFLGSPNMGIAPTDCLNQLEKKIASLDLQGKILFKGFVEREIIYEELGPNHIFVTASTHSDENFGMALMRSLAAGALAVASDWGGHKVFKKYCNDNIELSPVTFINGKPVINPEEFSILMNNALEKITLTVDRALSEYFSNNNVTKMFKKIIKEYAKSTQPLELSAIAQKLHSQQLAFEQEGNTQKAFTSYQDPIAQLYLLAYAH